jgi:Rrf2 family transcriptional regulator, iron-sulfur cluster assembly transcription factor
MIFSKSFGYAVRGVLYIALMQDEKRYVQVEEIAARLSVPRHFMGKIMKKMVKEGVLISTKGPAGGFSVTKDTMNVSMLRLIDITEGLSTFHSCALRQVECSALNPCPVHFRIEEVRSKLKDILANTHIKDLMGEDKADFIRSISTGVQPDLFKNAEEIL